MSEPGKRVSWVELYLDVVFVLAVGQIAHVIAGRPSMHSVWIALGLFVTLWWTWIGFTVLYNRHGDDAPAQRLLFLAGSVPAGVAAVAIAPASTGDAGVLALSLAVTRLVLAAGTPPAASAATPCAGASRRRAWPPRRCSPSPRPSPDRSATDCGRPASSSSRARPSTRIARRCAGRGASATSRRSRRPTRPTRSRPTISPSASTCS
jgi:hypothetical protein